MNKIKMIASKIGMDKSIAYSSGARVVQGFTGVASVFFITTFLTGVEQGFYYTFGSILALQVFFELGLTGIMTQYVAHEASHLTLNQKSEYEGEEKYKSRLSSLLRFCVKWYSVISALGFFFLLIVGNIYFDKYGSTHDDVEWHLPWVLICIGTSIKLFQSPLNSILMGLGFVKDMSKAGFYQQLILPAFTWIGLACGFKLYVMGIGYLLSVIYWQIFINRQGLTKILINLWKNEITERVGYMKEIFPFQWRIALSWVSGYFIFQLFNPVLFATEGAVVAGQMGMTMQALNALMAFTHSWINTKVPLLSTLIAQKKYVELDIIFNKATKQTLLIGTSLTVCFVFVVYLIQNIELFYRFGERFLPIIPLLLMSWSCWTMFPINCWATYLRCHKKEPLLVSSVVVSLLCCFSTLLFGKFYGLYGITIGFACIRIVSLIWIHNIYRTKKNEWHGK